MENGKESAVLTLIISLSSPVVAVIVAVWGFRTSTRSERLRMFFDMQERYLSERVRNGRRIIHVRVIGRSVDDIAASDAEDLSTVGYALAVMNTIAICSEGGYIDERLLAQSMGRSFASAVSAARPYIDYVESVRGFRPYPFAERLAERLRNSAG